MKIHCRNLLVCVPGMGSAQLRRIWLQISCLVPTATETRGQGKNPTQLLLNTHHGLCHKSSFNQVISLISGHILLDRAELTYTYTSLNKSEVKSLKSSIIHSSAAALNLRAEFQNVHLYVLFPFCVFAQIWRFLHVVSRPSPALLIWHSLWVCPTMHLEGPTRASDPWPLNPTPYQWPSLTRIHALCLSVSPFTVSHLTKCKMFIHNLLLR